jgi:hypothetical protein
MLNKINDLQKTSSLFEPLKTPPFSSTLHLPQLSSPFSNRGVKKPGDATLGAVVRALDASGARIVSSRFGIASSAPYSVSFPGRNFSGMS